MTRLRARAPRGKRAYGKVPRNRGKNTTLIAAITLEGAIGTSMTVEGATGSEAFEAYVETFLAPTLEKGQVVVLDGLGAHRPKRIRELIEARGADLVFLPSYSPDFNPIEEAFSKVKALVRKEGVRVREVLVEAIGRALAAGCTHSTGPAPKSTSPKEAVDLRLRKRRSGLCREGTLVASSSSSVSAK
jgi:transposase